MNDIKELFLQQVDALGGRISDIRHLSGPEWTGAAKAAGFPYVVTAQDFEIVSGKEGHSDRELFVSRR
jgi:hypothetical protein